jgi:hypothetical protein
MGWLGLDKNSIFIDTALCRSPFDVVAFGTGLRSGLLHLD